MSEPTSAQQYLDVLNAVQAALAALVEQSTGNGAWAASGPLYLNGWPIVGGHPDAPGVDKAIRLTGGPVELLPGIDGHSKILGIKTPQPIKRDLSASLALGEADNGSLFVAQHSADDPPIVVTLPGLALDYGENPDAEIMLGGTFFCQVFHAGGGGLSFAVLDGSEFLIAGVPSSSPISVDPGKVALAMYLGNGLWGVF